MIESRRNRDKSWLRYHTVAAKRSGILITHFTVDTQETLLSVNRYGEKQHGYAFEELVGSPRFDAFCQEDARIE